MNFGSEKLNIDDVSQSGSGNTQIVAKVVHVNNPTTPLKESKKSSIIQDIIDLELSFEEYELDVKAYDIQKKVDHNKIESYRNSFEFFMGHRQLIQSRLLALENNLTPLATNKLFKVIRNLYFKHVSLKDPDEIISKMCTELSSVLQKENSICYDNITYIPSIIFYVFSECQIFSKPTS